MILSKFTVSFRIYILFVLIFFFHCFGLNEVFVTENEVPAYILYNEGVQFQVQGLLNQAVQKYSEALLLKPRLFEALNNLGVIYSKGNDDELTMSIHLETVDAADDPVKKSIALNNVGNFFLLRAGRDVSLLQKAADYFDEALACNPENLEAIFNRGKAWDELGRPGMAESFYRRTLEMDPSHGNAWLNLANIYITRKEYHTALEQLEALCQDERISAYSKNIAYLNRGQLHRLLDDHRKALLQFKAAKSLLGNSSSLDYYLLLASRTLCIWEDLHDLELSVLQMLEQLLKVGKLSYQEPVVLTPYESTLIPHISGVSTRRATALHTAAWNNASRFLQVPLPDSQLLSERKVKLRIAYLSYDFRDHPMGHLTHALITGHNPHLFHIIAASYGPNDNSKYREIIEQGVHIFLELARVSDWDATEQLNSLNINILIDLMAHTKGARLALAASKPAHLVVNYLGYPGTMGSAYTDYAIVDYRSVPPETAQFFTEKLVYLPHHYQANFYNASLPACFELGGACQASYKKELGVDPSSLVICNFNTLDKMEPYSWHLWMNVLKRVPNSKLVLLAPPKSLTEEVPNRLLEEALGMGILPSSILFLSRTSKESHIARVSGCDLFVDSLVYGAHSTASDTLWAAVPLVTVQGWGGYDEPIGKMPGRVASTLIRNIGLAHELVTFGVKEAEDLAVRLLTCHTLLAKIRSKIGHNLLRYTLFNSQLTTQEIERSYHAMWELKSSGLPPQNLLVLPDLPFTYGQESMEHAVLQLGISCLQRNELKCAKSASERLLQSFPKNPEAWHLAGLSLFQDEEQGPGRIPEALQKIQMAIKINPNVSMFHTNLGHALFSSGDLLSAQNSFKTALLLDPQEIGIALPLQRTLLARKDYATENAFWESYGAGLFKSMSISNNSRSELITNHAEAVSMGNVAEKKKDAANLATMLDVFNSVLEINPTNYEIMLRYGAVLEQSGRYQESLNTMLNAVKQMNIRDYQLSGHFIHKAARPLKQTSVAIYCYEYGQTWWPNWGPSSLTQGGLGGSEEAVVFLSRELVKLGYHVEVYNEAREEEWGPDAYGLYWYPYQSYNVDDPADVFVAWRYHISMQLSEKSLARFLWLQDRLEYDTFTQTFVSALDGIFCLSSYHVSTLPRYAQSKGFVTPNGIDPSFLENGENQPNVFVYGSAPDRGLQVVLEAWPQIRSAVPNATLEVYYGFSSSFLKHIQLTMPNQEQWVHHMHNLLKQKGVILKGMVDHPTLARAYASAGFILYPTVFPETGCVTLMKAMCMGAIPITSKFATSTLPELTQVYDLGPRPLVGGYGQDPLWKQLWIEHVIEVALQDIEERRLETIVKTPEPRPIQKHRKEMKTWARERFLWQHVAGIWKNSFDLVLSIFNQ